MKKEDFLRELERLLSGISEEERADAIAFYRSYFEDAGEENEASVLAELESPQKVAESILKDLGVETQTANAWNVGSEANTGSTFHTESAGNTGYYNTVPNQAPPKKEDSGKTVLMVVLAVLTSPIWLTVLLVLVSVLFGVVCAVFGVAIAAVAVMVSLIIVGFVLAGVGITLIVGGSPAAGIGLIGGGCIVLALGILAVVAVVWVCGVFLPWAVKGIWNLCKKPFDKRKERAAV